MEDAPVALLVSMSLSTRVRVSVCLYILWQVLQLHLYIRKPELFFSRSASTSSVCSGSPKKHIYFTLPQWQDPVYGRRGKLASPDDILKPFGNFHEVVD